MKAIVIHPSVQMVIKCPECGFVGKLTVDAPPERDFKLSCVKCKARFAVKLNQRSDYRKSLSVLAEYTIGIDEEFTKKKIKSGKVLDISRSGLRMVIDKSVFNGNYEKTNNKMMISMSLPPKREKLEFSGNIVRIWSDEKSSVSLGIKFSNLSIYVMQELAFFLLL